MADLKVHQAFLQALQHHEAGRLREAEETYRQILSIQPTHAQAMHFLGVLAYQHGRNDIAIELIRNAIALQPNQPEAYSNLGLALHAANRFDEAVAAYHRVFQYRPDDAIAFHNLGNSLHCLGRVDEAVMAYREALRRKPDYASAFNNMGNALKGRGDFRAAVDSSPQANAVSPTYSAAYDNLGTGRSLGHLDGAISAIRRAVALAPQDAAIHSNLIYTLLHDELVDGATVSSELRLWNQRHAEPLRALVQSHVNDRQSERRIRVGFTSPDLRNHVVGRSLLPYFQHHDHELFELVCYADSFKHDEITIKLQRHAHTWRNVCLMSDEQLAQQIRDDQVDILVDLSLHTAGNRLLIFARKPAPVQVTYLAYCGSSGMPAMDYRISDPQLDLDDSDLTTYPETTIRLRNTYWCYQARTLQVIKAAPVITNGFITFGCLNSFLKVSQSTLILWIEILVAIPHSRLLLHATDIGGAPDVTHLMEKAGVDAQRIQFVGRQPAEQYLETYSQIDIALDPFPYTGGITTLDALWMGVPVVTLSGRTAVGRGGRTILTNLGLQELIASTPDQYKQLALDLARDTTRLIHLRSVLRDRMLASPIMDAPGFARDLEAAFRQMWRNWCESA